MILSANQLSLINLRALRRFTIRLITKRVIRNYSTSTFDFGELSTSIANQIRSVCLFSHRKFHFCRYLCSQDKKLMSDDQIVESLPSYDNDVNSERDSNNEGDANCSESSRRPRTTHAIVEPTLKGDLSLEQCEKLREQNLAAKVAERVVDGLILRKFLHTQRFRAGFSYSKFLLKKDLFNSGSAILTSHCVFKMQKLDVDDHAFVLNFYDTVLNGKFSDILQFSPLIRFYCLANTVRWKEAVDAILNTQLPPQSTTHCLILITYLNHGEIRSCLDLLAKLGEDPKYHCLQLTHDFHEALLQCLIEKSRKDKREAFTMFKEYVNLMEIFLDKTLPPHLESLVNILFDNMGQNYRVSRTNIGRRDRICANCSSVVKMESFTQEQYELMKRTVLSEVLKGDDVFRNSTPQEMKKFLEFVGTNAPFDLVVDGLNLFYSGYGRRLAKSARYDIALKTLYNIKRLTNVKKICLIAREHLTAEFSSTFKSISEIATIFRVMDRSTDDPFVLYAALAGGSRSYVVSRDSFGFLDGIVNVNARILLKRWKRVRVISDWDTTFTGVPRITLPTNVARCFQSHDDVFHIPLDDPPKNSEDIKDSTSPRDWLCISKSRDH